MKVLIWDFDGTLGYQKRLTFPGANPIWMMGDNPEADIAGTRRCGLRAILVHKPHPDITPFAPYLFAVEQILENPG
jgi:FMN phosphatase YigB (HAD superfamily)